MTETLPFEPHGILTEMGRQRTSKVALVLDRLEAHYGPQRFVGRFDPLEELVSCILSQHTADANSFPAFTRLRETFESWQDVVDAGPERVADVVRSAGLANQKARNIVRALQEIKARNGDHTLENLRRLQLREAREWLQSLPGVGPKTASIVLCFSFGMPAIPVDTHVFRVSNRLGLLPQPTNEVKAHDQLLDIVPEKDAYRYHTLLIQHGRHICKAQRPQCPQCPVLTICPYGKELLRK